MPNEPPTLTRREAVRRATLALGGALSTPTLAGLLAGCRAERADGYVPRTLTGDQFRLVTLIADHVIPATDTPGAVEAGVPAYVDAMLTDFYPDAARDRFLRALDAVDATARSTVGSPFAEASRAEQVRVLEALDAEAFPADGDGEAAGARTPATDPPFMRAMKELTVTGYYTSEIGQTVELRPVPFGEFRGDIPFDDVGRAWA